MQKLFGKSKSRDKRDKSDSCKVMFKSFDSFNLL